MQILTSSTSPPPHILTFFASRSDKAVALIPESDTGASVFGTTSYFPFASTIDRSVLSFTILGLGITPREFRIQTEAFVIPSRTYTSSAATTRTNFTVATLSGTSPSVRVSAPVPQLGTLGPVISTFEDVDVIKIGKISGYDLWDGSVDLGALTIGAVTIEILHAAEVIDTLLVGLLGS